MRYKLPAGAYKTFILHLCIPIYCMV